MGSAQTSTTDAGSGGDAGDPNPEHGGAGTRRRRHGRRRHAALAPGRAAAARWHGAGTGGGGTAASAGTGGGGTRRRRHGRRRRWAGAGTGGGGNAGGGGAGAHRRSAGTGGAGASANGGSGATSGGGAGGGPVRSGRRCEPTPSALDYTEQSDIDNGFEDESTGFTITGTSILCGQVDIGHYGTQRVPNRFRPLRLHGSDGWKLPRQGRRSRHRNRSARSRSSFPAGKKWRCRAARRDWHASQGRGSVAHDPSGEPSEHRDANPL